MLLEELLRIAEFVGANYLSVSKYVALAIVAAALLRTLNVTDRLREVLQRRPRLGILTATVAGCFTPICSCTVIPLIASLLRSRVPLGAVMAFWLSAPLMDPSAFLLTAGLLGWEMAWARLATAVGVGLAGGYITHLLEQSGWLNNQLRVGAVPASCCGPVTEGGSSLAAFDDALGALAPPSRGARVRAFLRRLSRALLTETRLLLPLLFLWLTVAFVLEAVFVFYLPAEAVHDVLTSGGRWDVLVAAAVGIPLYVNGPSALSLTAAAMQQGLSKEAALAFLTGGAVTTVPAMLAVFGLVRKRLFTVYLLLGLAGAVASGLLFGFFQ